MGRAISYNTYKNYAKKYGIKLSFIRNGKRVRKSIDNLQEEIFKYETDNDVGVGLYYY
jgi:hypothetical protein